MRKRDLTKLMAHDRYFKSGGGNKTVLPGSKYGDIMQDIAMGQVASLMSGWGSPVAAARLATRDKYTDQFNKAFPSGMNSLGISQPRTAPMSKDMGFFPNYAPAAPGVRVKGGIIKPMVR